MHFKIKDKLTDKQVTKLMELPPMFLKKLVYMRWVGGAFAHAIETRYRKHKAAPNGALARSFYNSGGMWSGFESQITGKRVVLQFNRSSFHDEWALRDEKKFKSAKARARWERKMERKGLTKKVKNRLKARSVQRFLSKSGVSMVEPSRSEVNALLSWMETHIERNVFAIAASRFDKRPIADRYNLILPKLPNAASFK